MCYFLSIVDFCCYYSNLQWENSLSPLPSRVSNSVLISHTYYIKWNKCLVLHDRSQSIALNIVSYQGPSPYIQHLLWISYMCLNFVDILCWIKLLRKKNKAWIFLCVYARNARDSLVGYLGINGTPKALKIRYFGDNFLKCLFQARILFKKSLQTNY